MTLSRRDFFKVTGGVAAGAGLAIGGQAQAAAQVGQATLPYPHKALGKAAALKVNSPVAFQFPDAASGNWNVTGELTLSALPLPSALRG